ncbi:aromatic motif membrane protein [Mycoplasma miroungirhinis]|uniref:Lipoprotein n=1 Tax=Mycoplasma miroungirhinis TaxID=754516 RepID=A0A6M4JGR3_9MOLU|nr:aromatic motif membrane protein [Mycoplasma miroungirhinis]QJR44202.1 hypothetical protein HLA92_02020 [Mycoplasma miroungirhinis]
MNKIYKKILMFSSLLSTSLLPILAISCTNSQNNTKDENQLKTIFITDNNTQKEQNWNIFLNYEHVNALLNLVFKNEADKKEYIQKQKNIPDDYLELIKNYLFYINNIVIMYRPESISKGGIFGGGLFGNNKNSKKVVAVSEFKNKLEELYKQNWLWFLFNIDKFVFSYNEDIDQFSGSIDLLTQDTQKNSLENSPFITLNTNQIEKYSIYEDKNDDSLNYIVYLLTKQGLILNIQLTQELDNPIDEEDEEYEDEDETNDTDSQNVQSKTKDNPVQNPIEVEISPFAEIYPSFFENQSLIKDFDLLNYVRAQIFSKNIGSSKKAFKIHFDDKYGGSPKRFTLVYVNNENTYKEA